jgi:hypothetical protein
MFLAPWLKQRATVSCEAEKSPKYPFPKVPKSSQKFPKVPKSFQKFPNRAEFGNVSQNFRKLGTNPEKLMCDGTLVPCMFDSAVVFKSKSLKLHTRLLSFSTESMTRTDWTVIHARINPSISRFSCYIPFGLVRIDPSQSARMLRRNLSNLSQEKRIDPKHCRNVWRVVQTFRAELTLEQLDDLRIE